MGSPASPVLAALTMEYITEEVIKKLPFYIPFMKIYVDDTILIVNKNNIDTLLEQFNNFHPRIQFTAEIEIDNSIPFLDCTIIRHEDGTITTDWYQKPSNSGRILNYLSYHHINQKKAVIKCLLHRVNYISHENYKNKNWKKIESICLENNYPKFFIKTVFKEFFNTRSDTHRSTQPVRYQKFPYIEGLSHRIDKVLKPYNVKLALYNNNKISNIYTKLKDKIPTTNNSNVVYSIPCFNCNKQYIGQTSQLLINRIKQHRYDCNVTNQHKKEKTALAQHHFTEGHLFNFDNTKILHKESNKYKRNISEMVFINNTNNVNYNTDVNNLNKIYNSILKL